MFKETYGLSPETKLDIVVVATAPMLITKELSIVCFTCDCVFPMVTKPEWILIKCFYNGSIGFHFLETVSISLRKCLKKLK